MSRLRLLSVVLLTGGMCLGSVGADSRAPAELRLVVGELRAIPVEELFRVAIGKPDVADVTIVSEMELLLHAKQAGTTSLIVWDRNGQQATHIVVAEQTPEQVVEQLTRLFGQLGFEGLHIKQEGAALFLDGQVATQQDLDRLEQLLGPYPGVTNLVTLAPPPPPPAAVSPPSVKLTVQLIEMNRDATDKFGVDWKDSLTFTETTFDKRGPAGVSLTERIDEAFRFGALSRTGFDPVLNLLVSQGKARILAEPKLVAASGKEATAALGLEVPVLTATSVSAGTVTQNIEFKKTGVELRFKPTVLEDGHSVQLVVDAKVSSIDKTQAIVVSGITVPGFKVRQTQTEIVVDSGEAVLIAGLLQDQEQKSLNQIPGIGSMPVLGNLFRSTEFVRGQTELIILVTPEVTRDVAEGVDRAFVMEQALVSAEVAASVEDPSLRYALQVQGRIAKSIRFPVREQELGMSGRVKLRLHIFRDGTLGQATVSESSGIQSFDAEAMKAAESQSPYPAFPPELVQQDLWVEVPVLFRP